MTEVILDASALLALIQNEKGAASVQQYAKHAVMSTVNFAEVLSVLVRNDVALVDARRLLLTMVGCLMPFDEEQASVAGSLKALTKKQGLSLGDCACLALGLVKQRKVITTDKVWQQLKIDGIDIEVIR